MYFKRFGGPVVLARQIRLRWNRSKNNSIRCNSMPFLVRCLSYIRNAKHAKQNKFTRVPSKSTERLTIAQLISNWRRCRKTSRLEPEVIDLTSDTDSPKDKSCEKRKIEAICETSAIVYFYYLYYESNFPSVQVEIVTDLRCPLCSIQLVRILKTKHSCVDCRCCCSLRAFFIYLWFVSQCIAFRSQFYFTLQNFSLWTSLRLREGRAK